MRCSQRRHEKVDVIVFDPLDVGDVGVKDVVSEDVLINKIRNVNKIKRNKRFSIQDCNKCQYEQLLNDY